MACNCKDDGLRYPARRRGSDVQGGSTRSTVQLRSAGQQNDDGGGISGFSGISGSGGISASAAAAAGFRAGGRSGPGRGQRLDGRRPETERPAGRAGT